jgi:aryl-alcohol dehydrogenase-like predicted oxidoreductase
MHAGFATSDGTKTYASRFKDHLKNGFFRPLQGLTCSSLGLGTYLGTPDETSSENYVQAVCDAVRGGINLFDTSINYRHQRSERDIGAALKLLLDEEGFSRDNLVVCTKAGFLTPGAIPSGVIQPSDVVGGVHCMKPEFLEDQLDRSCVNLGVDTVDVFYIHNPEAQLRHIPEAEFYDRLRMAFTKLEELVEAGKIRYYGTATWGGYRSLSGTSERLSLSRISEMAQNIAGDGHHFRFVQLPYNMAMTEAFTQRHEAIGDGDPRSLLHVAHVLGISVVASASLHQGQLLGRISQQIVTKLPGATSDAQRSIQFTRSTPGVGVALVGMGNPEHVRENLGVAKFPPLSVEGYINLFRRDAG